MKMRCHGFVQCNLGINVTSFRCSAGAPDTRLLKTHQTKNTKPSFRGLSEFPCSCCGDRKLGKSTKNQLDMFRPPGLLSFRMSDTSNTATSKTNGLFSPDAIVNQWNLNGRLENPWSSFCPQPSSERFGTKAGLLPLKINLTSHTQSFATKQNPAQPSPKIPLGPCTPHLSKCTLLLWLDPCGGRGFYTTADRSDEEVESWLLLFLACSFWNRKPTRGVLTVWQCGFSPFLSLTLCVCVCVSHRTLDQWNCVKSMSVTMGTNFSRNWSCSFSGATPPIDVTSFCLMYAWKRQFHLPARVLCGMWELSLSAKKGDEGINWKLSCRRNPLSSSWQMSLNNPQRLQPVLTPSMYLQFLLYPSHACFFPSQIQWQKSLQMHFLWYFHSDKIICSKVQWETLTARLLVWDMSLRALVSVTAWRPQRNTISSFHPVPDGYHRRIPLQFWHIFSLFGCISVAKDVNVWFVTLHYKLPFCSQHVWDVARKRQSRVENYVVLSHNLAKGKWST